LINNLCVRFSDRQILDKRTDQLYRFVAFKEKNGRPHNAPRYYQLTPISCHFWDCKTLTRYIVTSPTCVSGASLYKISDLSIYYLHFPSSLINRNYLH